MIATVHTGGASFKGVVDYCLSEGRAREDERDELRGEDRGQDKAGRVAWSETRNVAAEDPQQAARVMAATASRSEELKELAGVKAGGRALEKPVCHYSLSWAKDEKPGLKEMGQAVTESLEKMGLADRQAVMIAHRDTAQPHVHVVVNRVSVEDGRAAKLGNSYLKLSRWAEGYEREQGRIRCPQRVENNAGRDRGEWVRCASMKPGRYRRGPGRESEIRRRHIPAGRNAARDEAASLGRRQFVRNLEQGQRQQWGQLYRRHEQERRQLSQDWGSLQGRVRQWRAQGKHWDELAGAIRGKSQVRAEWEQGIEGQHRRERAALVRDHGLESRRVEHEWAAVDRQREQEAARGREPGPAQQQQERKPAKSNEEHSRKIAAARVKQSGPSVGPQRPERTQESAVDRQREAEAERQREQEAAQQREAELRRAQEAADAAERELVRQREAAAAEQERAAAAKKAKKLKVHPDVQRLWDQYGKKAEGEVWGGPSEDAAWVRDRKALAGQWNEEKEKAAVEEGRQSKARGDLVPLHERWEPPKKKKEGLVSRILSARREAAAEQQAKQEKEAWETSRPEREAAERARRAWHIESNPAFETFSVRERRLMVNLWDKRFPMPERIEKPAVRERRIEEVSTKMNRDAFHSRELALDRPKREAMLERAVARQPEQQQERTRDPGPTRDYGPSR